jgi:uncharacterized protein
MRSDMLKQSPLDNVSLSSTGEAVSSSTHNVAAAKQWKPSRFNVQATTAEGWLLLWNTYSSSMNAFQPAQRSAILKLIDQKGVLAHDDGIVGYLCQRGYLVPENADELRRIQYAFGKENHRSDRLELIILASEDCNFRCEYCYEDFRRGTMRKDVRDGIKKLVENRADHLREITVSWFGGEPLYGMRAIEDLAPFFVQISEKNNIEYYSHMTTNAYLLTEDVFDRLLSWRITDFQITLDGLPEDHDRTRPTRDGRSTFQVIYDNLINMSKRDNDFSVVIRVNFSKANVPGLEKFLELLEKGFRDDDRFTISFHTVGRLGGDNDTNLDVCGRDEAHGVRMKLKAAARLLGLKVTSGWKPGTGVGAEVCYAARPYNFIIGAHGDLMKCTVDLDKKDRNLVGKLLPNGTLDLDVDKLALWTEPAFERDTGCQSCHMLPACQGVHCPQIRMDHQIAPCPPIRRTAKREMIDYFEAKQAATTASTMSPLGEKSFETTPVRA